MTPDEKHKAIAAFQNVDLAFCRIFSQHDFIDTAISDRLGKLVVCAEIPKAEGERIAGDVALSLARIALETK